ncbi:hypothetical protein E2C01_041114 [Portunus trituberculatus]|uniref:Uncharacterized protein n=1 Tax=Portunus trituberculatus TaxID=210409 RepID=A0A5B7FIC9_PORTR|nr:hypothetical protein [Portunus trituberculatus]
MIRCSPPDMTRLGVTRAAVFTYGRAVSNAPPPCSSNICSVSHLTQTHSVVLYKCKFKQMQTFHSVTAVVCGTDLTCQADARPPQRNTALSSSAIPRWLPSRPSAAKCS